MNWCTHQASTILVESSTISWSLLKFMSIESVMSSKHLILCHPFLLLPSVFPRIRVFCFVFFFFFFQWVSSLHQVTKALELQLEQQSFQWIFRVYFFRIDWFDPLAVQGTLKSLHQHRCSKPSTPKCSAVVVQLSHLYTTNRETIVLTIKIFVGKVMSLLFNTLFRFVIAFLPRSKHPFNFMTAITVHSDFGAEE